MVSFEIFVKAMPPSLSELKVLPSFCFAFIIPDDRAVTNIYIIFSQPFYPLYNAAIINEQMKYLDGAAHSKENLPILLARAP